MDSDSQYPVHACCRRRLPATSRLSQSHNGGPQVIRLRSSGSREVAMGKCSRSSWQVQARSALHHQRTASTPPLDCRTRRTRQSLRYLPLACMCPVFLSPSISMLRLSHVVRLLHSRDKHLRLTVHPPSNVPPGPLSSLSNWRLWSCAAAIWIVASSPIRVMKTSTLRFTSQRP